MMKLVNEADFENDVLKSEIPVVVDFFATWCGPCKMIAPVLDQLADEFAGKAKIVKLDVDQAKQVAIQYGVKSVPTLVFFKDGEIADKVVGAQPKSELKNKIAAMVG
ncbi:MAG: thioredoxin [Clostridiales bacterium]|jgi:thioredoxin 1|nr:thioredoxin [Clostridiales bacterium]